MAVRTSSTTLHRASTAHAAAAPRRRRRRRSEVPVDEAASSLRAAALSRAGTTRSQKRLSCEVSRGADGTCHSSPRQSACTSSCMHSSSAADARKWLSAAPTPLPPPPLLLSKASRRRPQRVACDGRGVLSSARSSVRTLSPSSWPSSPSAALAMALAGMRAWRRIISIRKAPMSSAAMASPWSWSCSIESTSMHASCSGA